MDERLEKALEFSNFMVTFNNQKRVLKEKYSQDLIYYHAGAQFTVTKELINFCYTLLSSDNTEVIILDDNDLPVQISIYKNFTPTYLTYTLQRLTNILTNMQH